MLGCGATIAELTAAGGTAQACILSGTAQARRHRPATEELTEHARTASALLGMAAPILGDFPNLALNTVPQLELVRFIESAMEATGAHTIFTHHPADLNDDHLHVSRACRAAARLWQRRAGIVPLRALYFMEVLSSTDWAFPAEADAFRADSFMPVGADAIDRKVAALQAYDGVMRPAPHSRSTDVIRALAVTRGAQANVLGAEAFQAAFATLSTRSFLG